MVGSYLPVELMKTRRRPLPVDYISSGVTACSSDREPEHLYCASKTLSLHDSDVVRRNHVGYGGFELPPRYIDRPVDLFLSILMNVLRAHRL